MCSSYDVVWKERVVHVKEMRNACNIFVGEVGKKNTLQRHTLYLCMQISLRDVTCDGQ